MAEAMTVAGIMRVKNEARWIRRSIESILPLCNAGVTVLDDHSTDDTAEIAQKCGAWVIPSPFEGLDEVRDKNLLLADFPGADWLIMIDGDEVLESGKLDYLRVTMQRAIESNTVRALAFGVLYLWDREDQIRVDGVYRSMSRVSAFRPGKERFEATGGVNFHCGNCPQGITQRAHAGVSLLHYGYMDSRDRIRKYEWYRAQDPANQIEDEYRHIVIGDLFPAESRFRHGGPLELRQIG
jgi:glycosyltransferase involved in cell wall biosynthesis